MSTRYNDGSHYENHPKAAEMHELAAHAHRTAELNGKQDHLSAHELSRQALEHSHQAHQHSLAATVGHGVAAFTHADVEARAKELWTARGCPEGSPDADWFRATEELRSRAIVDKPE